jgi:RNA polymerase sigma-70 factor (ECF subfamily)
MDLKQQSDEQLMQIFQNQKGSRKRKAFDFLYLKYAQSITEYFYYALHYDKQKAQDFMHDLFLKIIEKPLLFDPSKKFKTWIFSIAANMCKNEYRKTKTIDNHKQYVLNTYEEFYQDKATGKHYREAIFQLNEEHREVIILRYKFDLMSTEIAKILNLPEGTIRSRLFYAKKELAIILNPNENEKS